MIVLFVWGIRTKQNNIYRDLPRHHLNTKFQNESLIGILSNTRRVENIDNLLYQCSILLDDDMKGLCLHSISMIHYLINKKYYLSQPWLEIRAIELIDEELKYKISKCGLPDFIIINTIHSQNEKKHNIYFKKFLIEYNYILIYQNSRFQLHLKPSIEK